MHVPSSPLYITFFKIPLNIKPSRIHTGRNFGHSNGDGLYFRKNSSGVWNCVPMFSANLIFKKFIIKSMKNVAEVICRKTAIICHLSRHVLSSGIEKIIVKQV